MKTEKAIEYFELHKKFLADINLDGLEAHDMAIEALKEKLAAEKNEPLTMEELKQLETGPIYVVPLDPKIIDDGWQEWCVWWSRDGLAMIPGIEYTCWYLADYGTKWIAYRREPKEVDHGKV